MTGAEPATVSCFALLWWSRCRPRGRLFLNGAESVARREQGYRTQAIAGLLALLGAVGSLWMCLALMAGHVVSRTWPLLVIRWLPHVGDEAGSKSKPLADQISTSSLAVALLWCAGAMALSACIAAAVLFESDPLTLTMAQMLPVLKVLAFGGLASALIFLYLLRLFARRLQGFTGDCLGTTQQLCEITFYLGCALALGGGL